MYGVIISMFSRTLFLSVSGLFGLNTRVTEDGAFARMTEDGTERITE